MFGTYRRATEKCGKQWTLESSQVTASLAQPRFDSVNDNMARILEGFGENPH